MTDPSPTDERRATPVLPYGSPRTPEPPGSAVTPDGLAHGCLSAVVAAIVVGMSSLWTGLLAGRDAGAGLAVVAGMGLVAFGIVRGRRDRDWGFLIGALAYALGTLAVLGVALAMGR